MYIVFLLKFVINKAFNDAGFACAGISKEDDFEGAFADGRGGN